MVAEFVGRPVAVGVATLVLMWSDWVLTVLQERERRAHHSKHYRTYPVDTIEGNPSLQEAVRRARLLEPKHVAIAVALSAAVACAAWWFPVELQPAFLGYVWGLFLIVDTTHLGNLIAYRASRRGLHGELAVHQRTGFLIQMGRYLA